MGDQVFVGLSPGRPRFLQSESQRKNFTELVEQSSRIEILSSVSLGMNKKQLTRGANDATCNRTDDNSIYLQHGATGIDLDSRCGHVSAPVTLTKRPTRISSRR